MSLCNKAAAPVVRAAAGFHHHAQRTTIIQRVCEGATRQARALHDPMLRIGEREFEHLFCQIDSDSRSMHGGLLSCGQLNASHPVWHFDADIPAGGVHSISRAVREEAALTCPPYASPQQP